MKRYVDKVKLQEFTLKLNRKQKTIFAKKSLEDDVAALMAAVGSPLVANSAASMTDTDKIYVYTGNETGYTSGNWYYNDGSEWKSGGIYNNTAVETDKTLKIADMAADSKTVGTEINDIVRKTDSFVYENIAFDTVSGEYVSDTDGSFAESNNWSRTDYIQVDNTRTIYIISNISSVHCAQYDEDYNYIMPIAVHEGIDKYALSFRTKYIALSTQNQYYGFKVFYEKTDEYFDEIKTIEDTSDIFGIVSANGWKLASINSAGEMVNSWYYLTSELFEIVGGGTYSIEYDSSKWRMWFNVLDSNLNLVRQTVYFDTDKKIYTFDKNAKFIQIVVRHYNAEEYIYPSDSFKLGISIKRTTVKKLKVMTYNIGHYHYGTGWGIPDEIYDEKLINYRRFIGKEFPDVIGIQEYDSRMDGENTIWANDVLWDHFYPYKADAGSWCTIKSKYDLSEKNTSGQLSTGRYYAEANMNGIYLLNVHLSVGAEYTQTRLEEADEILSMLEGHDTFIIFGDFNCEPGEEDELFGKFTEAGCKLANCGWFGKIYSWSNNREDFNHYEEPTGTRIYYLDNIIVSDNIDIENVYPIPEAYKLLSSDHIPIVAELTF